MAVAEGRGFRSVVIAWMLRGEWRAHPGRVVVAALAVAVGVALGFAVHLVNGSAQAELTRAMRAVTAEADLEVVASTPLGFAERLYADLARAPGVKAASPVVELKARFGSGPPSSFEESGLRVLGLDPLRAAEVTPSLAATATGLAASEPERLFDTDAVSLSPAALAASGAQVGEPVVLSAGGRSARFRIAGVLPVGEDAGQIAVVDIAAAQWRFGSLGRLQRVDLRLQPGASLPRATADLPARLPAEAQVVTEGSQARRGDNLTRAYRVNLQMLALVALLTGGFLVYSAQSLSVARRRPQFALLRVLGVKRRGLLAQVLAEGMVVGGVGALLGLALGAGLATAILMVLGGDLGGGVFSNSTPELVVEPMAVLVFFALGLAAALVGSLLPALEAGRARPGIALKDLGDRGPGAPWRSAALGVGLLACGALAAFAPPVGGVALFGYLSIGLLLAGGVAAMPWLARTLLAPFQRAEPRGVALDLALSRLWGAPSQAAVALCGIVASVSLMAAMGVMVTSLRGSVDSWLADILPGDLLFRVESGGFDPEQQARVAAAAGVAGVFFQKTLPMQLSPEHPPAMLVIRPIAAGSPQATLPLIGRTAEVSPGVLPVWVSEPAARLYGLEVGERLRLPLAGAPEVVVAGVWRDYARQAGAIAMDDLDFARLTGDRLRNEAAVDLEPGVRPRAAARAIRAALPKAAAGEVQFVETRQLRAVALRVFDSSFALTYALEAIAIGVGLAGVAATMSAQTLARAKEFGMLRHLGVLRRQIIAMLAWEGAALGAVGLVAGLGLGLAMSQVLIHVVNPQSFNWTMEIRVPLLLFGSLALALVSACALTAVLAGRRALSADAVRAVREDW